MFRYATKLNLRDTDAAGVAFFAAYYSIAHDAYEDYWRQIGRPLSSWLSEVHLPIVHSEADYKSPLRLDDPFEVVLRCERLGDRSFTIAYDFVNQHRLLARLRTVHVAVDSTYEEPRSTSLPSELRRALEAIMPEIEVDSQK